MTAKVLATIALVSIVMQMISARCISSTIGPNIAPLKTPLQIAPWESLANNKFGYWTNDFTSFNGGVFEVISSSPIAPTGVSVYSENAIQGTLSVAGTLPFLGTVALEGSLPTAGAGVVQYGCGNGNVAITRENTVRA